MKGLSQDVRYIQNPALGGLLQWRFVVSYVAIRSDHINCPLPLVFLVLPIMLHEDLIDLVMHTNKASGLRAFAGKFGTPKNGKSDLLLAIHDRSSEMKQLSLDSLKVAMVSRLLYWDIAAGSIGSLSRSTPRAGIPESVSRQIKSAEKLGKWCAEVTLHEISSILKVRF